MSFKIGDWIKSYRAGIWQIYRILEYKCLDPVTGLEHDKTMIFSKCFVTNKFKRSFKEDCCDPALITPLSLPEQNELDLFIAQNKELYEKFCAYEPKTIDCIYNARIGIPKTKDTSAISQSLADLGPVRDLEIGRHLSSLGYSAGSTPSWTAQFVSENFTVENGYLVFKFSRILEQ